MHSFFRWFYRHAAPWPPLQEKVALLGDSILTRLERHDNRN